MATLEEHKQRVDEIYLKLKKFLNIELVNLTREIELGNQLSFKKGEPIFTKIINLFKKVNEVDLIEVPINIIVSFESIIDHAKNIFEQIVNFDPNTTNPASLRDNLVNQLEQQFDNYYLTAIPILTIGLLNSSNLSVEKEKLKQAYLDIIEETEASKKESVNILSEIQEVLIKARQAALEVGVAQHYLVFKEESEEHKKLSELWLARTIKVLIGIGILGIILLFIPSHDTASISLIQFTITKIILFSVLFYGLALCTRNYKAHKHNSILNKHRQNALKTFETFTKAAGNDTQTKNAVLLEATHTIFSNQQTGYLNKENDSDSPNRIIEIFKNFSENGK